METEIYWEAVKNRDARFDGAFVFAVKTTGIFCRPSCRARRPKRENVVFFDGGVPARSGGFRPCLRCHPEAGSGSDPRVVMVVRACEMMRTDDGVSLEMLSAELGLSTFHLQRTFKQILGVSPKKFAEAQRLRRFKSGVRGGSDVVTAMYDAGFGSSSRLYERAANDLGMTPSIYKKGGKGMNINYTITETDLGKLLVARTPRGICSVMFADTALELEADLRAEFPNAEITPDEKGLRAAVDAIVKYLSGKERRLILPLDLQATAFQLQVWEFLRQIPYGETRSYAQIAEQLGGRNKVRAVAQACARNRVALVVPCHRVIASDGALSGYRWGIERKKRLLEREKAA